MIKDSNKALLNVGWDKLLFDEYHKSYFKKIIKDVQIEYKNKEIYPIYNDLFNAFKITDYQDVKVLILGQDPYHGYGQAHGLSFSTLSGNKRPPSLKNIFKELESDLNIIRNNNDLTDWAEQGVLLLNTILTVEKGKPLSHNNIGWQIFTDKIIELLNEKKEPIVFVLWGNNAKLKSKLITNDNHLIIEGVHPSPLSANRGYFGSKPFSKINRFLKDSNYNNINW